MSAALVGEQRAVVWYILYRNPVSATRWKFGVWIGPPKVLLAPKPTSSVKINRTLGAPAGASTPFGKSGVESLTVRPIFPWNGGSGLGRISSACCAFAEGKVAEIADAETREVVLSSSVRRLIPSRWVAELPSRSFLLMTSPPANAVIADVAGRGVNRLGVAGGWTFRRYITSTTDDDQRDLLAKQIA